MSHTIFFVLHFIVISIVFKTTNGLVLKMIPIDSPQLQILPQHYTRLDRHRFLTNLSLSRVYSYSKNSSKLAPDFIRSPLVQAAQSYYLTHLTFGKGHGLLSTYLLLDTSTSETWVQCEGCNPCIELDQNQKDFSFRSSPTFKRMRVQDPMCYPQIVYKGSCGLDITYGRGARTIGFIGRDSFYLETADGSRIYEYPSVAFGCGLRNENFDFGANTGPHNVIAGIHGLAPGPRSFLTQLNDAIRGRFSYCLLSNTVLNLAVESHIYFGDDAQIIGDDSRHVETISMYEEKYHLYLNGISVDGTRVPIDPSIFELDEELYTKGFFIDSGAPYTILARSAYYPLREAMATYFENNYGWHPVDTEHDDELCYSNYPTGNQEFPSMILHFELKGEEDDVDWILESDNVFIRDQEDQGFCMNIHATDDPGPSLFGAYQQANFNILYDVENGLLSFVPKKCHET